MEIKNFKFREADELVPALQNDVEGIILSLREEDKDKKKEKIGIPAGFSRSLIDWHWLKNIKPISSIKIHNDVINFSGAENELLYSVKMMT